MLIIYALKVIYKKNYYGSPRKLKLENLSIHHTFVEESRSEIRNLVCRTIKSLFSSIKEKEKDLVTLWSQTWSEKG